MKFSIPGKDLSDAGNGAGVVFMEYLESEDSSISLLSKTLKSLIVDDDSRRKRRDVGAGDNSTTKDVDAVLFVLPLIQDPSNPSVNFFAQNADGGVAPQSAVLASLQGKEADVEAKAKLSDVSFGLPAPIAVACGLFCEHFALFVSLIVLAGLIVLLLCGCCCCMHARDRRREHYSPADEEKGVIKGITQRPKNGAIPYSESPLSDDEIKKDEMLELTPESSNNSLRTPSPPMPNGRKMSDCDSLVDDPHEGWVIPYDQAEDHAKSNKHVSIAKPTNKPTTTKTHQLNQNMEDTRL